MNLTIKIGGASGINCDALLDDVAALDSEVQPCIVHGGSDETTTLQSALGRPAVFFTSPSGHVSRRTDREDLEAFAMATARINRLLVEGLARRGVRAFGLSGLDGRLAEGKRKASIRVLDDNRTRIVRNQWTGRPSRIDAGLLQTLNDAGCLPVVAPLLSSEDGEMLNTDGDRLAASIAGAMEHETLVILTNVPGLLEEVDRPESLIPFLPNNEALDAAMRFAKGRMRKKLLGAREALALGVGRVVIASAQNERPLTQALAGRGTVIGQPLAEVVGSAANGVRSL